VSNVFGALSGGLFSIKEKLTAGDTEGAGEGLKKLVGDVDSLAQTTKDMKQIEGYDNIPLAFDKYQVSKTDFSLADVSDSILGESIHPEVIEQYLDFSNQLKDVLDGIDHESIGKVWSMNKKKRRLNLDHQKAKPTTSKDEYYQFRFDSNMNSEQFGPINSFASPLVIKRFQSNGGSLPRVHSFLAKHEVDTVTAKHQRRLTASDDVCLPQCDVNVTDEACNCNKLFDCVNELDEYDLAGK
jgi:hypothetical protein